MIEIQPRDTSQGHFDGSLAKSVLRLAAGCFIIYNNLTAAGALLIAAEALGILEEMV